MTSKYSSLNCFDATGPSPNAREDDDGHDHSAIPRGNSSKGGRGQVEEPAKLLERMEKDAKEEGTEVRRYDEPRGEQVVEKEHGEGYDAARIRGDREEDHGNSKQGNSFHRDVGKSAEDGMRAVRDGVCVPSHHAQGADNAGGIGGNVAADGSAMQNAESELKDGNTVPPPAPAVSSAKLLSEAELTKLAVAAMKAKLKGDMGKHARLIEKVTYINL